MFNSYEERPELPIDPCQDTFIGTMKSLGYELGSIVEPHTSFDFGYWYSSCSYSGVQSSFSIDTTNSPNLDRQLQPAGHGFLDAYEVSIASRFAVARPMASGPRSCVVAMETSFGSIIASGGPLPTKSIQGETACEDVANFLRELEPLLGD